MELFTPHWGWYTPYIDVNTHTQTVLPHWGCVYCFSGVFVHSVGFYALYSLLGNPNILSVLVCFASVCIIIRILIQCFIVVRFYP